ncbi:YfhO family protein [Neobacillus muris]|uniref:YfhO family protein n=1 Tax=Neobacillus muris TaxID=2941334 RepID=UPI00203FE11F|nr:YfhO family protein [Neobacillus muris]
MRKLFFQKKFYFLSFLVPFFILGSVFAAWRVYPFGERSILMGDEYTQYIQFYNYLYDVLKGDGSLLYTWEAGMGLNFWSTFAYYLSSPISFVILIFDKAHLPEAFVLMILIKIGLSGLFMFCFLSEIGNAEKMTSLTFSTVYSLISFAIGYFFNSMWLDSIYLLPLVLLAVENLFKSRYVLLIISLSILFISNFYMAYIAGIFTFLYFLYRGLSASKLNMKDICIKFAYFMFCTILAGGISAFITVPTYFALKSNSYQHIEIKNMLDPAFGFFEFLPKLYSSSQHLFDLPNVFSGLLVLLFAPLFFLNGNIRSREKLLSFAFLIILWLSLQIKGLSFVWHAFSQPSGYDYRFAFVLSFTLIMIAYKSYAEFKKDNVPSLFKVYLVHVFLLMLLTKMEPELMSIKKALMNMAFLTIFSVLLYGKAVLNRHRKWISGVIILFVCLDMGVNAYQHIKTLNSSPGYSITRAQYNMASPAFENLANDLRKEDKGFYRTNSAIGLTPNDSIRYGYKGMTNFNTLANGTLHAFMQEIGYSSTLGSRSLAQNQGLLSSDALFAFKYMISDKEINKYGYDKLKCYEDVCLYHNKNFLPIGFMLDEKQVQFNTEEDNPFEKQNTLLGNGKYFTPIPESSIQLNNLDVTKVANVQYIRKKDPSQEGSIEITFKVSGKKQLYTLLAAGKGFAGYNETRIFVNDKPLGVYPTFHNDRVLDLGAYNQQMVTIRIEFLVPKTQLTQNLFYQLDIPSFEKRINQLRTETIQLQSWTNTSIKGQITAKNSNAMFFSIPYDEGWTALVDNKKVPVKRLGGFIGLDVNKGVHSIELVYLPKGFKVGMVTSASSMLILILLVYVKRRKRVNDKEL